MSECDDSPALDVATQQWQHSALSTLDPQIVQQPQAGNQYRRDALHIKQYAPRDWSRPHWPLEVCTLNALSVCASRYVPITEHLREWPPHCDLDPEVVAACVVFRLATAADTAVKYGKYMREAANEEERAALQEVADESRVQLRRTITRLFEERSASAKQCPPLPEVRNTITCRLEFLDEIIAAVDNPHARDVISLVEQLINVFST